MIKYADPYHVYKGDYTSKFISGTERLFDTKYVIGARAFNHNRENLLMLAIF